MKHQLKLTLLASAIVSGSAQAEISLNGFASVVAGQTLSSDETTQGYDNSLNFKQDSLFAIQASSDLGDGLGVTAQILSKGENDFQPTFAWAYASYDVNDNLRFLAGRQRAPFYMYSDFLDVSYAYPWISPPSGTYDIPIDTFDGLGLIYDMSLGSFDSSLHLIYGSNTDEIGLFGQDVRVNFEDMAGGALTVSRDWLTLRAAYFVSEGTMPVDETNYNQLVGGWGSLTSPLILIGNQMVSSLQIEEDDTSFGELGFQMDFGNIIFNGEYTRLEIDDSFLPVAETFYVLGGYRFDNFLIHATYGVVDSPAQMLTSQARDAVPVGAIPDYDMLIAGTDAFTQSLEEDANYYTLGLRWDLHDSAALKFEYTQYNDELSNEGDAALFRTALVTVF